MTIHRTEKEQVKVEDSDGNSLTARGTTNREQMVWDEESIGLLGQILKELKIMNLHLSLITDETIDKTEVE